MKRESLGRDNGYWQGVWLGQAYEEGSRKTTARASRQPDCGRPAGQHAQCVPLP